MFIRFRSIVLQKEKLYNFTQKSKFNTREDNIIKQLENIENRQKTIINQIDLLYNRMMKLCIISSIILWISIPSEYRIQNNINKLQNEIKNK
jgi:hypothetical protein